MLGSVEVRDGAGCLVEVSGARLRALLALLALRPGQVAGVGYLIDELWESHPPDGAANALQALVSRLRRALPDGVVGSRPGGYQLAVDRDEVDVFRFERLAGQGRALLAAGDPASAAATLREALALWRGPAFADAGESETVRAAVIRVDELRLAVTEARIDADLRLGSSGAAPALVAELEGLLAAHPVRETLSGLLMRALAAAGRRGAALEVYERVRERLADQLGADPPAELAALHLEILRANEVATAAPSSNRDAGGRTAGGPEVGNEGNGGVAVSVRRTNLRAELTSFVGREADLERVGALLREHRLVTLTGPGGAGKTRLAAEAARAALGRLTGGVWLAELAPVTDPAEVAPTVLGAFGLREQALLYPGRAIGGATGKRAANTAGGAVDRVRGKRDGSGNGAGDGVRGTAADALDRLVAALAGRRALLVLDNCEHLVAAAATLADRVLAGCPEIRILATSREPLNINGETLWPVGPLGLPPDRTVAPDRLAPERVTVDWAGPEPTVHGEAAAEVRSYASVELFEQRARAVNPGFSVTPANAEAVQRICRALDGMPLAIELAAARMRSMTAEQVAARLDDRFRLLTGGSRTALPRHQTLRAVVDWSWDLLEGGERALLRRLSIFAGGGTLEAIEQVCAGSAVAAEAVAAEAVAAVAAETGPTAAGSAVTGSAVAAEDVFDLLAALVDKSLLIVRHSQDGPRYRMLEIIRAYGVERLAEAGETKEVRRRHAAYFLWLAEAGQHALLGGGQLEWLRRLAAEQDNLHAAVRGAVAARDAETAAGLIGASGMYWWLRGLKVEGGDLAIDILGLIDRLTDAERTEIFRDDASRDRLAMAYAIGGMLTFDSERSGLAVGWLLTATTVLDQIVGEGNPLLQLAAPLGRLVGGDGLGFPRVFDQAVDYPHPWVSAVARLLRGQVELNVGAVEAAEADFRAAEEVLAEVGERWGMGVSLSSLATLAGWRGEYATAITYDERTLALVAELGSAEDEIQARLNYARDLWLAGGTERERSRAELARALRDADELGWPEVTANAAYTAGHLARLEGDLDAALAHLTRGAEIAARPGLPGQLAALIGGALGYLAAETGDLTTARARHDRALRAALATGDGPVVAQVLAGLADLALREGDPMRAATLLGASEGVRGTRDRSVSDEFRLAETVRGALTSAEWDAAFQRGRGATLATLDAVLTPDAGARGPRAARTPQ
jgi:predicted ATPase/DNA-binding SARP family transcriptional activator